MRRRKGEGRAWLPGYLNNTGIKYTGKQRMIEKMTPPNSKGKRTVVREISRERLKLRASEDPEEEWM